MEIPEEKKFLGVCLWLSQLLKTDVTVVRIVFIIAAILSLGTVLIIYFIIWAARELKLL